MNKEYITKFLATEVLGWRYSAKWGHWIDKDRGHHLLFDPFTDIAHVFMVVEAGL